MDLTRRVLGSGLGSGLGRASLRLLAGAALRFAEVTTFGFEGLEGVARAADFLIAAGDAFAPPLAEGFEALLPTLAGDLRKDLLASLADALGFLGCAFTFCTPDLIVLPNLIGGGFLALAEGRAFPARVVGHGRHNAEYALDDKSPENPILVQMAQFRPSTQSLAAEHVQTSQTLLTSALRHNNHGGTAETVTRMPSHHLPYTTYAQLHHRNKPMQCAVIMQLQVAFL